MKYTSQTGSNRFECLEFQSTLPRVWCLIQLRQKPARIVAVREFSGRWSDGNIDRHEQKLLDELNVLGVEVTGEPELARYNSPFTPWFMRRNAIIVPVNWMSVDVVQEGNERIATEAAARL